MTDPHDLYGLPFERFVPERTALAKELRGQGKRAEAAEVAKLPKPSVAAWAVNQLVRTQARAVGDLFEAGDALQQAQADVVAGEGSAGDLRGAAERERSAVSALVEAARGLLDSDGHPLSPTTLERVSDTLHAAALDSEARAEVQGGALIRELRHVGLGEGGLFVAPPRAGGKGAQPKPARQPTKRTAGDQDAEREQEAARERAERRAAARRVESEARRQAQRAARELERAEKRHADAAAALREAEETLDAAREQATEAEAELRRAEEALEAP
jgi:hypothetical protein